MLSLFHSVWAGRHTNDRKSSEHDIAAGQYVPECNRQRQGQLSAIALAKEELLNASTTQLSYSAFTLPLAGRFSSLVIDCRSAAALNFSRASSTLPRLLSRARRSDSSGAVIDRNKSRSDNRAKSLQTGEYASQRQKLWRC